MKAIKEFFSNLIDGKPKLKIEVQKLYYLHVDSDNKHAILLEPVPYPTTYQAMVGIQNISRRRTAIKDVRLEINGQFLPCVNQRGTEFGPNDYKQLIWVFPAHAGQVVKRGRYSLTIIDSFGNAFVREGRFPVGDRLEQVLREPI